MYEVLFCYSNAIICLVRRAEIKQCTQKSVKWKNGWKKESGATPSFYTDRIFLDM